MSMEDKQKLDSIDKHNQIINRNVNVYPNKTQIVNLNKNLTSCLNGIILVWRLDDIDDLYHYQYVLNIITIILILILQKSSLIEIKVIN